ncbi:helix-turn-helix transcriptional regulator [Nonomuraea sp. NPDC023979]|uniref:helix-turn-helix transcriptional regulator n=1 Tax=Nonomuraea sp. NPDC023979 TaxID=3154796 RepID=UPI0033E88FB6
MKTDETPKPWRRRPGPQREGSRPPSKKVPQDGDRIYKRRIEKRLKQGELAHLAGISPQHMSHIESGKYGASPEVLHKLATVLDCTVADLMPEAAA